MTPAELSAIRKRLAPTQKAFAEALGYSGENGVDAYRRYERGKRPVPPLLAITARLLDERGSLPEWLTHERSEL
jgi:transcriptional regulator with XRE-family HTH domain